MAQVIIVGGGLAGLSAAHTVLQHGGRVLLLDKSAFCGGNSTKATSGINAAGTRAQRGAKIPDTPELFEEDTKRSAGEGWRPDLGRALTYGSGPAVEWLRDEFGLNLDLVSRLGAHSEPRTHRGDGRFPGMMITYGLMEHLEAICEEQPEHAAIINKAEVTKLITSPQGEVVGVEYSNEGESKVAHGAVIIATGGFGADYTKQSLLDKVEKEWRALDAWKSIPENVLPQLRDLPTSNGSHCSGDGIKVAVDIGAGTVDLKYVQVHPTGIVHPNEPEAPVKFLAAEALRGHGAIMVNGKGERFCDELGKRDYVTGQMWQSQGPFLLILNSAAAKDIHWHCEHYMGRGVMKLYKSGEQLAQRIGIPASKLEKTFREYSMQGKSKHDPFGKKFFPGIPFQLNDEFFVAEVTPVVHYTMGGLLCSAQGEVKRNDDQIIPGLFAAGEVIGGIHGHNRLGGSSLLDCVVFGRLSGQASSRFLLDKMLSNPLAAQVTGSSSSGETIELNWGTKTLRITQNGEGSSSVVPNVAGIQAANTHSTSAKPSPKAVPKKEPRNVTMAEVAKHNTKEDCWVVIQGKAYDVTDFLADHPGGAKSILQFAGADSTKEFFMLHKPEIIDKYAVKYYVGDVVDGVSASPASATMTTAPVKINSNGITPEELKKHNTPQDCWIAVHGKVYDVTSFLDDHPGGKKIVLKYAGMDSTAAFDASGHPKDIVEQLGLEHMYVGEYAIQSTETSSGKEEFAEQIKDNPPISHMLNLFDIEAVARKCMKREAWDYYSSGSDDEITLRENHSAFHRIWLRPRCLVDVSKIDLSTKFLGFNTALPIYITATALGRLAHPEGETVLTRAANTRGIIQMCPTLASCTLEEMTQARAPGQVQFFQLYVNHNREVTERLIRKAEKLGCQGLFVTVDAPQLGRREKDMRNKFSDQGTQVQKKEDSAGKVDRSQGTTRAISQFIDPSLSWKDIEWMKTITKMPIVLKGVQCGEDAVLAAQRGVQGIVCSNHGGRQLDLARSGIEVLEEVMEALTKAGLQNKIEVYMDGGVRRGTDVIKAIALGAKGVGIGRPVLYGMAAYGQDGVEKVLDILQDELIMGMRLLGAPSISDIKREMVSTRNLGDHFVVAPTDHLAARVYERLGSKL